MRWSDTIFKAGATDAFVQACFRETEDTPSPPGQTIQPKVLLAHWQADAPGTVDVNSTLGYSVVSAWRDQINGYALTAPSLTQAPAWVTETNMASHRPGISFDGLDDWLDCTTIGDKLNYLEGVTVSMLLRTYATPDNQIERVVWLESGASGKPRLGYGRTGIGPGDFYADGITLDADTVVPISDGAYDYDGWASHIIRRDYLRGTLRVDYNAGIKLSAGSIQTLNYGDATPALRFRVGAESGASNPGQFYIHTIKLYTYAISDTDMTAEAGYLGGLINA